VATSTLQGWWRRDAHSSALVRNVPSSGDGFFRSLHSTTLTVALVAGLIVTIIDKEDFPDYGTAVWWAIVTLATVGYGDVVPHTGWGRVVGSVVIIVGVTFIAFLTAVVTSLFVEEEQKTHRAVIEDAQRAYQDETRRLLEDLSSRLSTVETLLRDMQGQRR
jgi:voltage-gated potassium channel